MEYVCILCTYTQATERKIGRSVVKAEQACAKRGYQTKNIAAKSRKLFIKDARQRDLKIQRVPT